MNWNIIFTQFFSQSIGVNAVVFAMAAIGLNIHFGYTGLLNFGHVGFMAAGAYGVGMTVFWFDQSYWIGLIVGVLYCVALALILGVPTLRRERTISALRRSRRQRRYESSCAGEATATEPVRPKASTTSPMRFFESNSSSTSQETRATGSSSSNIGRTTSGSCSIGWILVGLYPPVELATGSKPMGSCPQVDS